MKPLSANVEQIIKKSTAERDYFYGNREKPPWIGLKRKLGKLILTNKRLVFLPRKGLRGQLKGKSYMDIEAVEEDLGKEGSFTIPLNEITRLNTGRKRMTNYLVVYRRTEGVEKPYMFVSATFNIVAETYLTEGMSEWVEAINSIKKALNSS